MGKLRWYKRDPVAALEGMSNLTLEERGAYNTVLDLIYARDGKVDDDDRFIAGWLRVDVRVWRRIKKRLVDVGKLYVDAGAIHNSRADVEVDAALSMVASVSEANSIKGRKSGDVRRKNKTLDEPKTEPPANTTTATTRLRPSLRSGRARARTPLVDDWKPSDVDVGYALSRGFALPQIEVMARAFPNHHRSKGNLMADWSAAWRTWCENEIKFQGNRASNGKSPQRSGITAAVDKYIEQFSGGGGSQDGCEQVGESPPRLLSHG